MSTGTNKERLEQNNLSLEDMKEQIHNLPEASGGGKPNIFMQLDEPETKDGIWFKTSEELKEIIEDNSVYASEQWDIDKMSSLKEIPYEFFWGSAIAVGTNIYLLGGSEHSETCYKYDTITDTYKKLTDIPYEFYAGSAVAVGTDVYLFGSWSNAYKMYCYKYDTVTGIYSRLTDIPYSFDGGSAVVIGTDIYLLGSTTTNYSIYCYKYDTVTDTYEKLTDIPYQFYRGSAVAVGTDIYLFGGNANSSYRTYCYKYDTVADTYSKLADIPYEFYNSSAVVVGTDVYLFGSLNSSCKNYCYKYDTVTGIYSRLTDIPYQFYNGSADLVDTEIYLVGGSANRKRVQVMTMFPKEYTENSIVIANNKANKYQTKLIPSGITNNLKYHFDDTFFYKDGTFDTSIETYIGDGTEWIKIRGGAE